MTDLLELLWLDPKGCPRIRRKPAWRRLLDEARGRAPLPDLPHSAASVEDRADVFEILARAEPSDRAAVDAAAAAGTDADGRFIPPLLLVAGDLSLGLDDLETLRGFAANATAFMADDEPLEDAVGAAHDYAAIPGLIPTPRAVSALIQRVREAFTRVPRGVPADFLDTETARALLEHRKYQTQVFQGAPHLRATLTPPGDGAPLLAFLPTEVAARLPLLRRFPVRALVEVHIFSDQFDPHPVALHVLALARSVPRLVVEGER